MKSGLAHKVRTSWYKHTLNNPVLIQEYGTDGWEDVFLPRVGKISQEEMGRLLGVTLSTSQRYHKDYRKEETIEA